MVEHNITENIIVVNAKPTNINERMAKYHAKGLSIAAIQDYKIVRAKGNVCMGR